MNPEPIRSDVRLPEWRCTRPNLYPPGTLGHLDQSNREGYYVRAATRDDAIARMRETFPADPAFDVEIHKPARLDRGTS